MADGVEEIVNQGFRAGKVPLRIQDIYEGSDAARVALEIYSQARDELLDARDWSFNRKTAPLTKLKGPPPDGGYTTTTPWSELYPAPDFLYEYAYPTDAVDIRAISPMPLGGMPDLDPKPAVWRIDNDPTPNLVGNPPTSAVGPQAKVIYCNITNALATYRSRVTNPAIFDPGFIAALVAVLGERFAGAFGMGADETREQEAKAIATIQTQSDVRG